MSRSARVTTEDCFTPEQRDFFRACSEMAKFSAEHPRGYQPFSAEASRSILLQHNVSETERTSGLKIENMRRFCQHYKIIQFDYDNPQHRDLLLPEIVALNETRRLQHLSQHDYGRVMKKKSQIIASFNGETESLEHGLTIGSTVVSFFAAKTSKIIHLLAESIGLGHKEGISKVEVNACPEYWETLDSVLIPKSHFTPNAQAQASAYREAYLESSLKTQGNSIHNLNEFINVSRNMQRNPASATSVYEMERLAENYASFTRKAGATFAHPTFHTSKNPGLTQLAHYLASPKYFSDNAKEISEKTLAFINSDSPEAAAFTEQTLCRYQLEFLNKIDRYSKITPDSTLDYVTSLMNAENIPENARSLYYQQVLSALPIKDDLSIDQIKFDQSIGEVTRKLDALKTQFGDLQKNTASNHRRVTESLQKLTGAVNKNAADISALKAGQQ